MPTTVFNLKKSLPVTTKIRKVTFKQVEKIYNDHTLAVKLLWSGLGHKGSNKNLGQASFDDFYWDELAQAVRDPENDTRTFGWSNKGDNYVASSLPNDEADRKQYYDVNKDRWITRTINSKRGQKRSGKTTTKSMHFTLYAPNKNMPYCRGINPATGYRERSLPKVHSMKISATFNMETDTFPGMQIGILCNVDPRIGVKVAHTLKEDMRGRRILHLGGPDRVEQAANKSGLKLTDKGAPNFLTLNKLQTWQKSQNTFTKHNDCRVKLTQQSPCGIVIPDTDETKDLSERKKLLAKINGIYRKLRYLEQNHDDLPIVFKGPEDKKLTEFTLTEQWKALYEAHDNSDFTKLLRNIPIHLLEMDGMVYKNLLSELNISPSALFVFMANLYSYSVTFDTNAKLDANLLNSLLQRNTINLDFIRTLLNMGCPFDTTTISRLFSVSAELRPYLNQNAVQLLDAEIVKAGIENNPPLLRWWFKNVNQQELHKSISDKKVVGIIDAAKTSDYDFYKNKMDDQLQSKTNDTPDGKYFVLATQITIQRLNGFDNTTSQLRLTDLCKYLGQYSQGDYSAKIKLIVACHQALKTTNNKRATNFLIEMVRHDKLTLDVNHYQVIDVRHLNQDNLEWLCTEIIGYLSQKTHQNSTWKELRSVLSNCSEQKLILSLLTKLNAGEFKLDDKQTVKLYATLSHELSIKLPKEWLFLQSDKSKLLESLSKLLNAKKINYALSLSVINKLRTDHKDLRPLFSTLHQLINKDGKNNIITLGQKNNEVEKLHKGCVFDLANQDHIAPFQRYRKKSYEHFMGQYKTKPNTKAQQAVTVYAYAEHFKTKQNQQTLYKSLTRTYGYSLTHSEKSLTKHRMLYSPTSFHTRQGSDIPIHMISLVAPNLRQGNYSNPCDIAQYRRGKHLANLNTNAYQDTMSKMWKLAAFITNDKLSNKPVHIVAPLVGCGAYLYGLDNDNTVKAIKANINGLIAALNQAKRDNIVVHLCIPTDSNTRNRKRLDNFQRVEYLSKQDHLSPLKHGTLIFSAIDMYKLPEKIHATYPNEEIIIVNPSSDRVPGGGCYHDNDNLITDDSTMGVNSPGSYSGQAKAVEECLGHLTDMMYLICADMNPHVTTNSVNYIVEDENKILQKDVEHTTTTTPQHICHAIEKTNKHTLKTKDVNILIGKIDNIMKETPMNSEYNAYSSHQQYPAIYRVTISKEAKKQFALHIIRTNINTLTTIDDCIKLYKYLGKISNILKTETGPIQSNIATHGPTNTWTTIINLIQNKIISICKSEKEYPVVDNSTAILVNQLFTEKLRSSWSFQSYTRENDNPWYHQQSDQPEHQRKSRH